MTLLSLALLDESLSRKEVQQLVAWCSAPNLVRNTKKTNEMVIDFRSTGYQHHLPLVINDSEMVRVCSTKFLGTHLTGELTSRENTAAVVKKAQQCLHFLCRLKLVELPIPAMKLFYRNTMESILSYSISS